MNPIVTFGRKREEFNNNRNHYFTRKKHILSIVCAAFIHIHLYSASVSTSSVSFKDGRRHIGAPLTLGPLGALLVQVGERVSHGAILAPVQQLPVE